MFKQPIGRLLVKIELLKFKMYSLCPKLIVWLYARSKSNTFAPNLLRSSHPLPTTTPSPTCRVHKNQPLVDAFQIVIFYKKKRRL